jgi:hypothetical protein
MHKIIIAWGMPSGKVYSVEFDGPQDLKFPLQEARELLMGRLPEIAQLTLEEHGYEPDPDFKGSLWQAQYIRTEVLN